LNGKLKEKQEPVEQIEIGFLMRLKHVHERANDKYVEK
jgi:hypothetical protein